jgi:hypothetical protein
MFVKDAKCLSYFVENSKFILSIFASKPRTKSLANIVVKRVCVSVPIMLPATLAGLSRFYPQSGTMLLSLLLLSRELDMYYLGCKEVDSMVVYT